MGRVDDAEAMGFDVIYFPPIHPIGFTKRKGRNNSVTSQPGEPGSPYAIGGPAGGHKTVEPTLGTLKDFDWLVKKMRAKGMEVALDFAINCSPDHPYVRDHPDWFYQRPDGSIKYAENPPKRYEDIYPLNFHCDDWKTLWEEMKSIILFWCARGVRIFRVDNPHTKPVAFWGWMIEGVQSEYPDAIFLSEAFTKPKMMKALAKAGFTQSYSYFTWRNTKAELTEYFTELTQTEMKDYYRANLFPNTPDILPFFLQHGGRPAFMIRATLAATLSSVYGIYSGFELCENAALPGREEYDDSEKYQFKGRDWNAPGQHQGTHHPAQPRPPRKPRAASLRQPAFPALRQRPDSLLHEDDPGDGQHRARRGEPRPVTTGKAATWKCPSRNSGFWIAGRLTGCATS